MSRLQNPWPDGYSINANSPYGYRIHPITRKRKFHHGVDVAGSFPVTVPADGQVMKIGWSATGGGHTVLIDHGDIVTVYYHGAHRTGLQVGQRVRTGDFIYKSGNTGASTGAHLHFEVRKPGGKWGNTLDPELYLPKDGQELESVPEEPEVAAEQSKPVVVEPQEAVSAPSSPRPISTGLARFFAVQKALKFIRRNR